MSETLLLARPERGLSLLFALLTGKAVPAAQWQSPAYRAKFLLRSLLYPCASLRHLRQIAIQSEMRYALSLQSTLPGKIHRPYLHLGLSCAQRAQAISQHYRFISQLPTDTLRQAMLSRQLVELAHFCGKEGEDFRLSLACNGRCEREGEVNLSLHSNGTLLAIATFSVTEQHGQPVMIIGGIQGASSQTPHEAIRIATKSCYGLFPKRLVLEMLTSLARASGIKTIQAVSDVGHTWRSLLYRHKKKNTFVANYDEFWQSLNGERISRHLWQLPLTLAQKPIEEIASKKRAEYRRRYELLEDIRQQFSRFH